MESEYRPVIERKMLMAMYWIWEILIGILAGFLAGKIMRGHGFGVLMDLVIGIVGSLIGGYVFGMLGMAAYGLIGQLIVALVGALLLLFIVRLIKKPRSWSEAGVIGGQARNYRPVFFAQAVADGG